MHNALWVFVGGGTGALLRYGVSVLVNWVGWHNTISTLLVNILGSFLLGWISVSCTGSIRTNDTFRLLLAVGLCGGFTTFGTFSSDIVNLLRNGAWAQALAYAFCSVLLSVAAFGCAFLLQSPSRAWPPDTHFLIRIDQAFLRIDVLDSYWFRVALANANGCFSATFILFSFSRIPLSPQRYIPLHQKVYTFHSICIYLSLNRYIPFEEYKYQKHTVIK